jgi:hypothetical protein
VNKHYDQFAIFFLCLVLLALAPAARSQQQSTPAPQPGAGSTKDQPTSDEAEANTSASTEALQKATQNPVASLISVPVQNNSNFGVNPGYRNQDVLNIQPVIPIGISKDWNLLVRWIKPTFINHCPVNLPLQKRASTACEIWCLHFSSHQEAWEVDLGSRTCLPAAYGNGLLFGAEKIGYLAIRCCTDPTRPLDPRRAGKQYLVGGRFRQPSGCKSIPPAVLHQLQLEEGQVHYLVTHFDSELGSSERQPMDGAVWRRNR